MINVMMAPSYRHVKWKKSFMYNMDFFFGFAAKILYPLGVSVDPQQVIIGRDGWLYLGDRHENTLTADRSQAGPADMELGKKVGSSVEAWDSYLSSKGVKVFRIMVGPNKGTIYSERMPEWARVVSPNPTDHLFSVVDKNIYIDLRNTLLLAKEKYPDPVYYKTDTHWNNLGAAVAFRLFAERVAAKAPDLLWPPEDWYEVSGRMARPGGDLARFLRLGDYLLDTEVAIKAQGLSLETTQYDFYTRQLIHKGGNPMLGSPVKPLWVHSPAALNKKKVLWLRDSFGTAMSPLMAATFSDVLQVHWIAGFNPEKGIVQLVEDWKPDYVFVTVVERSSRSPGFSTLPPPVILQAAISYKPIRTAVPIASKHLVKDSGEGDYHIFGDDPQVDFSLSEHDSLAEARYLSVDLTCRDGDAKFPIQFFWLDSGRDYYDEEHSVRLVVPNGKSVIDLNTVPKWKPGKEIARIRLDVESHGTCTRFKMENPSLGILQ